jgi:hypothetical protein
VRKSLISRLRRLRPARGSGRPRRERRPRSVAGLDNYRIIVVGDAVAEVDRTTHEAELRTMARIFADVKTTDEVVGMLDQCQGR